MQASVASVSEKYSIAYSVAYTALAWRRAVKTVLHGVHAGRRQHAPAAHGVRGVHLPVDDHHAQHAHRNDEQHLLAGVVRARADLAHREPPHGALVRTQDAAHQALHVPAL